MEGGAKGDLARIAKRMINPKAKLIMEEALLLVSRAVEVEEGVQVCLLCQKEVESRRMVEHHTFHYTVEEPGALLGRLATSECILRCPLPSCKPNGMQVAELNLHLATEHDMLKKVLEVDAREGRRELVNVLFYNHEQGVEEEGYLAEEEGKGEIAKDTKAGNCERNEPKMFLDDEQTLIGEESVQGYSEIDQDNLEVGELFVKDELVAKKKVVTMVDKKERKKSMSQALEFIKAGGSLRKAALKFEVPHESLRSSSYFLNVGSCNFFGQMMQKVCNLFQKSHSTTTL